MIKYMFTGHLTPRPPGTERAMCGLSGWVYLVADVEAESRARQMAHDREAARLNSIVAKHLNTIKRLRDKLAQESVVNG